METNQIIAVGRYGECDRCMADAPLYEVVGDLPGDWWYCYACARITARVLESTEVGR